MELISLKTILTKILNFLKLWKKKNHKESLIKNKKMGKLSNNQKVKEMTVADQPKERQRHLNSPEYKWWIGVTSYKGHSKFSVKQNLRRNKLGKFSKK
jgi:hypothetical protein